MSGLGRQELPEAVSHQLTIQPTHSRKRPDREAIGALLFATLCLILQKTTRRAPLVYWSAGWLALFVALAALFVSFSVPALRMPAQSVYVFGDYVFAYMLIAGCRRYITANAVGAACRAISSPSAK